METPAAASVAPKVIEYGHGQSASASDSGSRDRESSIRDRDSRDEDFRTGFRDVGHREGYPDRDRDREMELRDRERDRDRGRKLGKDSISVQK